MNPRGGETIALDPDVRAAVASVPALTPDVYRGVPPLEAAKRLRGRPVTLPPPDPALHVKDRALEIGGRAIPVRLYAPSTAKVRPILVNLHGGGWAMGSVDMDDAKCRQLSKAGDFLVVSVEYRLAPEHPFPAALDDAYDVICWLARNGAAVGGDPRKIAVTGASAGANIAAAVALKARAHKDVDLAAQWLIYPACDARRNTESYRMFANGPLLTDDLMAWFWEQYVSPAEALHPYASPLLAQDFANLPPTLVATAAYDLLRDEGEHYADKLRAAGVDARWTRYDGMVHGFLSVGLTLAASQEAMAEGVAMLKRHLNHP